MNNELSASDIRVFSVSEVNERISSLFELDPQLLNIAVMGELSNYKIYPSGHHYFTLKDAESSLKCVMFKTYSSRLRFRPENGMKVIAAGRIAVYPRDGVYQFYCSSILPAGQGDLQMQFEQLKAKLQEEGLFDRGHKKELPEFPQRIAVVTSSAGAAVRDIIRILRERWPLSEVVVVPVRVQGTEAAAEIAGAIRFVNQRKLADLIITGRGGGSMEDLWPFNEEIVARMIYRSDIPVISAVGHEPDVTISDYVADRRASTPSNAAEIAVPDREEFRAELEARDRQLRNGMLHRITGLKSRLETMRVRTAAMRPENLINERRMVLDSAWKDMDHSLQTMLDANRQKVRYLAGHMEALSPQQVLGRGYSITSSEESGRIVRNPDEVKNGEKLTIQLAGGTIRARCETQQDG